MAGGATVGSGRAYRLDPHTLPARGTPRGGEAAGATFIIEGDRAIVRRPSEDGALATFAVPLTAYRGVSVRMEPVGTDGSVRGYVELFHNDPAFVLALSVTDDPDAIAEDWQAWGRALNKPLLVIGQDGSIGEPLAQAGGVLLAPPKPRRRHSYFAGRRPRFLTRRKTGRADRLTRIEGREIIARN